MRFSLITTFPPAIITNSLHIAIRMETHNLSDLKFVVFLNYNISRNNLLRTAGILQLECPPTPCRGGVSPPEPSNLYKSFYGDTNIQKLVRICKRLHFSNIDVFLNYNIVPGDL